MGTAVAGVVVILTSGVLQLYQLNRLRVFLDPSVDPAGAGYNLAQVKLAIGSGGWNGFGPFHGPQTNGRFIPEQQTDFIFSAIGEQFGFIGAGLVIVALFLLCWRALKIASETTDRFGRIAATGVACWFGFQTFENIGMNLGIMPVTGVPLPFISYGGSSMFACWMAVGLLQNIKTRETG
jgi:rod shape determining protein RodA